MSDYETLIGLVSQYSPSGQERGAAEWLDDVMNPLLPASSTGNARAELDSIAALSRYFGGVPRRTDSIVELPRAESWKATSARVRGRGC